ncbi:MAG TPA: YfhO family protein [Candidatus Dormibacteraeota bacterium]|nr:YfhO family protein [Candidatus Dormibacteraeota bacterium]
MRSPRDLLAGALLLAAALAFLWFWLHAPAGTPAFDIYMYYHPNMLYAAQRLAAGGSGLLWNPWQNCGQPSFGISSTGLLYPANLFYLLVDPDLALRLVTVTNFLVAGLGAYALGRELGTGRVAALCGALAFQLGCGSIDLNTWGPQMGGTYVWLPVAMLCCERLLRAPTFAAAVGLGVALALPLLPGFPQVVFYTYQLIALRVLWELLTRRAAWSPRTIGLVGLGLLLAPLLTAVHLVPGIEMAARSVRSAALSMREMQPGSAYTWQTLRLQLAGRYDLFNPIVVVPAAAAGAWWCRRATRRVGAFYLLGGVLYLLLALGEATPLFTLYRRLPLGALFREPARFTWMTSFCLAVLCGLGVDALLHRPAGRWQRLAGPVSVAAAMLGLSAMTFTGLLPMELVLGAVVIASGLAVAASARWRPLAAGAITLAMALGLLLFHPFFSAAQPSATASRFFPRARWGVSVRNFTGRRLIDGEALTREADPLRRFATRLTPQDRSYFSYEAGDFSFMMKSASLFSLASVQDYEPQAARRYGDYYTLMRSGRRLDNLNQFYFPVLGRQEFRRPLLDLAAGRYVIVANDTDPPAHFGQPPLYPLDVSDDLRLTLYENPAALPRARWVPTARVVADPVALLDRLATRGDDPRRVLLLEEPPPGGFLGDRAQAADDAAVDFSVDEPEHVVLRVRAPARGFVHLADQHFPGWEATVNGAPAPILRASYLFRAVEVPAGESVVEFRYRPASLRIGAAISATTVLALIAAALWSRRTRAGR